MQNKQINRRPIKGCLIFLFVSLVISIPSFSQNTYLPLEDKGNIIIERLEILGQKDSILNFSKTRPLSRLQVVRGVTRFKENHADVMLSKVDEYYLQSLYKNNIEYLPDSFQNTLKSKKPIAKYFYRTPANFYEVHVKDFDLVINPVIQFQVGKEKGGDENLFLNSRGVVLRGRIANKIGFAATAVDNQERDPLYVRAWEDSFMAVPGAGYYKTFKTTGYDYFDATGYFTFNVTKYIDVVFGYDKNFIGNGYRSLFFSDFGNNALFLKLNTRIWKINYQNLFMELHQTEPVGPDRQLRKKYSAFHHLDVDIGKRVNVGLFEGIIFGRTDHFEFSYLNPIIFYRSIEQQNGSVDNSVIGMDFKTNVLKQFQFYGQFLLDDLNFQKTKEGDGWWGNKWGLQLGAKYINVFGIKNLDLQLEHNWIRPFTYSHGDSVATYTHYNQPIAHPVGANLSETIGILRYQPAPKWTILAKLFYWKQGLDTGGRSFGGNIFVPNKPPYRQGDYGYEIVSGLESKTMLGSLLLSYELKENLFLEATATYRKFDVAAKPSMSTSTNFISAGVRWNMRRRVFEF